jgi:hypothetical protein
MNWTSINRRKRLYVIAAVILLLGWSAALIIYLNAGDDVRPDDEGRVIEMRGRGSKMYRHDLESYGGRWSVVADDMIAWFEGLWEGRSLAATVAFIAGSAALGIFIVARHTPADGRGPGGP